MGNNVVGSTKITYSTKDGFPIEYIYYDLKGKNRFPPLPSNANQKQIQALFFRKLKEINATQQQFQILKTFNTKYQFRFVILHERKVQEFNQRNQLQKLRRTKNFDDQSFKSIQENRRKQLDDKLKLLENNQTAVKMHLGSIDRFISQKNLYTQFIKIEGIQRLLKILNKAITTNKQGTKTIFQNQIQILKFMKSLSDHNTKEYFAEVGKIRDYAIILMRAYHSVNIAVTAYVLQMLQDYAWKVEDSLSLMQCLRFFQEESNNSSLIEPFVETIYNTDNILMCCYNLRFINEVLISIVDDQEKGAFEQQLRNQRYQLLIEDIKSKLQQNYYKIDYCTFIAVSQAIYKHATKNKKQKQNLQSNLANRNTLNLQTLQQHLLVNFVEGFISKTDQQVQQESEDDEDDNYLTVYLVENDKKSFNKFVLDTFSEIQHYYKYSIIIDENAQNIMSEGITEEIQKLKKQGLSVQQYLKRIKGNCLKNNCEQTLVNCFKTLQYFQKNQWKKLQSFINQGLKINKNPNQIQALKKQIEQKEREVKDLKKQCHELKTERLNPSRMEDGLQNTNQINKLDMSLYQQKPNQNILTAFNGLPPPPIPPTPPSTIPNLPPSIGLPNLPPPPIGIPNLSPPPIGLPNLPPPPVGLPNLPPPPVGLPNLPPPPVGLPNLPPPPIGIPNLPPPPIGLPNLPPPPIGLPNLPPPPIGLPNLPPPPIGLPNLPPPPIGLPNLLPPPIGLPNLPLSSSLPTLSPPPLGMSSLPSLPSLGGTAMALPNLGAIVEEKKKPKKQPKVNLKACNYIILGYQKIKSTIWQQVDDSKVKLDESELESLFARAMPKKQQKVSQSAIILNAPAKKQKIKLLGPDKYRNFEIVLTKLKLPENGITQALTQCSGKYVVPAVLDSIYKILPSEQDQMMINGYDGSFDDLGAPQKFIKEITAIPQYANRVKALIFANNKEEFLYQIQSKIDNLTTAFQSLKSNYRLHYVLEVALALGNYLNGTGIKGGAWGFRLDTIQNMQEVTTSDNKMNAGFYLIKHVWKKYTFPIFDKEQIDMYQYVQKMPTSQVKADLGQLKKTLVAIEKAFKSKIKSNPNDRIDEHCQELLLQTKQKYAVLEQGVKKMDQAYNQCATFYCEDPNKAASDQIGKKIFKCVLFIFTTQKSFYQIEQRRKKQQARKAPKVQIKFSQQTQKNKPNPQSSVKILPKVPSQAIKLPMPLSNTIKMPDPTSEDRVKQLQRSQQEKQKKFLEQMMKKRSSKMVAFRQSRMAGNTNTNTRPQAQIDFLKGL